MRLSGIVVLLAVTLASFSLWIEFNKPTNPLESRYPVAGFSYNPYQDDKGPFALVTPSPDDISRDLAVLAGRTKSVRVYRASQGFEVIPELARKHGMSVFLTAWLDGVQSQDEVEVEAAVRLAGHHKNVSRLLIGNETQLTGTVGLEELIAYLDRARKRLRTPVSSAEPWDFWIDHPEVVSRTKRARSREPREYHCILPAVVSPRS